METTGVMSCGLWLGSAPAGANFACETKVNLKLKPVCNYWLLFFFGLFSDAYHDFISFFRWSFISEGG